MFTGMFQKSPAAAEQSARPGLVDLGFSHDHYTEGRFSFRAVHLLDVVMSGLGV